MKLRKSPEFRSVYASGVWIAGSPTEFRLLFFNNEPIEVEADPKDAMKSIQEEPYFQAEVIVTRPLAEWIKNSLDAFLKQTEVKPTDAKTEVKTQ
ncbi:MAG: hypothetical protein ABSF44_15825 [Candidatus Bathyarchaeia archaeon]|jgi:hypothetical protein